MRNGDKVYMKTNGEFIPVEIVETEVRDNLTRHAVKLGADVQGCKAGDIVTEVYSYVNADTAKMYGIKQDLFTAFH